jgi:hypothetical protein
MVYIVGRALSSSESMVYWFTLLFVCGVFLFGWTSRWITGMSVRRVGYRSLVVSFCLDGRVVGLLVCRFAASDIVPLYLENMWSPHRKRCRSCRCSKWSRDSFALVPGICEPSPAFLTGFRS